MSLKDKIVKNESLLDAYSNLDSALNRLNLYFKLDSYDNFIECLKKLKKDIKTLLESLE